MRSPSEFLSEVFATFDCWQDEIDGDKSPSEFLSEVFATLKLAVPLGGIQLGETSVNFINTVMMGFLGIESLAAGALGVITRLQLQNVAAFRLTEVNQVENTEQVLEEFDARCARHRHFEFLPLPHTSVCATVSTDLAKDGDVNVGEEDSGAAHTLRKVYNALAWLPAIGDATYEETLKLALGGAGKEIRTGASFEVFPHIRTVRFREMEYTVPAEHGAACMREILQTIKTKKIPVCFPLEYRRVKADDIWLSMFEGREGIAISVHQYGDLDYKSYFGQIEPIFWKYQGRPHWGKIHTLTAAQLSALYPKHWRDFHAVRQSLDPQGRLLNPYLKSVLGL